MSLARLGASAPSRIFNARRYSGSASAYRAVELGKVVEAQQKSVRTGCDYAFVERAGAEAAEIESYEAEAEFAEFVR